MATISPSFVRLPNAFPLASSSPKTHTPKPVSSFATRATDPETPPDEFDNRLSQVRLRYRSGTGKKAEIRKSRKSKGSGSGSDNVFLPPVPLKEPVSGGLKVDFGFSPYSERVNGRVALLGLTALLLVELATGKSVLKFHAPPVVLIQVYFVAAATAIYIKYEKERVSVWPKQ
ncbi:hypothetical protein M0R45_037181 [Rubus argutus]|uniref:Uncharacterized protein n=1 Tax=Rubus argutus TaxID=59490 RepID=A0AAW1VYG4_RUBAR